MLNRRTLLLTTAIAGASWWAAKNIGKPSDLSEIEMPDGQGGITIDTTGLSQEQRKAIKEALRDAKTPEEVERKLAEVMARQEPQGMSGAPAANKYPLEDHDERYQAISLHGWSVRVARDLLSRDNTLAMASLAAIDAQLASIARTIPPNRLVVLKRVPIWLELKVPGMEVLVYHPDGSWLAARGLNSDKGNSIDIPDARAFLMNVEQQPGMLLHELTHAYHVRELGEKNEEIARAYAAAKAAGLYAQVRSIDGSTGPAYALTDEKEYFAEITEAYFLKNDFYPFTRDELKSYDPGGFTLVESMWLNR